MVYRFDAVHWSFIELERMGFIVHQDDGTWTMTDRGHQAAVGTLMGLREAERILVIMHVGTTVGLDMG